MFGPGCHAVAELEQLDDPAVEDREQDRLRRRIEQSVEGRCRDIDPPLTDGVAQRPDRCRRRLRDERPDVLRGDRTLVDRVPERQLVELARRRSG